MATKQQLGARILAKFFHAELDEDNEVISSNAIYNFTGKDLSGAQHDTKFYRIKCISVTNNGFKKSQHEVMSYDGDWYASDALEAILSV